MKVNKKEYGAYIKEFCPQSPIWMDVLKSFVIGGLICTIGQLILNGYTLMGMDKEQAGTATSITLVFLSALLTGLSLYDNIAKHAGAGTLVPITGFANAVAAPAVEFRSDESDIIGHSQKDLIDKGRVWRFSLT